MHGRALIEKYQQGAGYKVGDVLIHKTNRSRIVTVVYHYISKPYHYDVIFEAKPEDHIYGADGNGIVKMEIDASHYEPYSES